MVKYFLIVILGAISFFAPAQVVLPDSVARFYLERNEIADILQTRHELMLKLVANYEAEIKDKDLIIQSYKIDYAHQDKYVEDMNIHIRALEHEIKRQKRKKNVFIGLSLFIFVILSQR